MEYLDNYYIDTLKKEDIPVYTKELVEAFEIPECYDLYLDDNYNHLQSGNYFLGAKLIKDNSLIGGVCFEKKPMYKHDIYIESLFVQELFRNQGIASNLLDYIVLNKKIFFKQPRIDLRLFCEEKLKSFYENKNFEVENCYSGDNQKILNMSRKI